MRFNTRVTRKTKKKKRRFLPLIMPSILVAIVLFFYTVNLKLTPIYTRYAEVQTHKIASHVINQAIKSRSFSELDIDDIIQNVPNDSSSMVTNIINADKINRVKAEILTLVEENLRQAETGNFELLPISDDIEYDTASMESDGGVVFFVPLGQATSIPLLGNLGPKIPIRFHVMGEVYTAIESDIREFGLNNAYVEINVVVTVNVQIIVPLATSQTVVQQREPVALTIIQSPIPQILNKGEGSNPQIEVPLPAPPSQ